MNSSDIIAAFALVIALISIWLSYRTSRFNKQLVSAEKRTHAHTVLFSVWIEAKELRSLLRRAVKYKGIELPAGIDEIEAQLSESIENLDKGLAWLQDKNPDDPLLLEKYIMNAKKVEALMKRVGPMINGLECRLD